MNIDGLLADSRTIWGDQELTLEQMLIVMNVVVGDIARITRDQSEGKDLDHDELKKELGNIIFSTIRFCDDFGYDPKECIDLAIRTQKNYQSKP